MTAEFDFIAVCRPGTVLFTRDRRQATVTRVEADAGLVYGDISMFGPCSWRRDGVYSEAPAGAAGPLDLMPPASEPAAPRRTVSLKDTLRAGDRNFCCD